MVSLKFLTVTCLVAKSCPSLCGPWTTAHQASLPFALSWSSLRRMSIRSVMLSSCLILWCSLLRWPSVSPSIGCPVSPHVGHLRSSPPLHSQSSASLPQPRKVAFCLPAACGLLACLDFPPVLSRRPLLSRPVYDQFHPCSPVSRSHGSLRA